MGMRRGGDLTVAMLETELTEAAAGDRRVGIAAAAAAADVGG